MIAASVGFQCPECVAQGQRTQRQAKSHFGGSLEGQRGTVTKILIGINVAVMVVTVVLGGVGLLRGGFSELHFFGAVNGPGWVPCGDQGQFLCDLGYPGIDQGGIHRLVTSMFLHYGIFHLLLNMYALWIIGRPLEAALGRSRFLALYLVSGLGGGVAVYLFSPDSLTAGASGAIYGLFAAFFIVMRRLGRDVTGVIVLIGLNVVITLTLREYLSVAGHFGGLVTGALVALGMVYAPRERRSLVQWSVAGGLFLILVAITAMRMLAAGTGAGVLGG